MERELHIDAPPSIVWSVTTDVERWPDWTPTVQSVKFLGEEPFGLESVVRIKQPGLPEADWRVTALLPGEHMTWQTRVRGMRMVATHRLTPSGTGTMNRLIIEMSGIPVWLLWPLLRLSVGRALRQENAGLKAKCEQIASALMAED